MLKIRELNVGNFVQLKNGTIYQLELKDFQSLFFEESLKNGDILPIQLTPEWLNKFGFFYGHGVYGNNWFPKGFGFSPIYRRNIYYGFCNFPLSVREFQYVHELQNHFFILKGEDLKINNDEEI